MYTLANSLCHYTHTHTVHTHTHTHIYTQYKRTHTLHLLLHPTDVTVCNRERSNHVSCAKQMCVMKHAHPSVYPKRDLTQTLSCYHNLLTEWSDTPSS